MAQVVRASRWQADGLGRGDVDAPAPVAVLVGEPQAAVDLMGEHQCAVVGRP
jgi:hypothetical protein